MNILLFGGFLGSGKTSVILQAAKFIVKNQKHTVAIVENEIGEIGIDNQVMAAQGLTVKGIFAGCVCCQITGELLKAIEEIHRTIGPDWLIIETTGIAVPGKIIQVLQKYCHCYDLLRTVVLVDAERWEELYEVTGSLVVSQVQDADLLLLNKIDLIEEARCQELSEEMRRFNESAEIHLTVAAGEIPGTVWRGMLK